MNIQELLENNKKIVLFDDTCNLCDRWVQLLLNNDPKDVFRFSSLQSDIGKELQKEYRIDSLKMNSIIVIDNYTNHKSKTTAIFSIVNSMGGLWPLLNIFWIIPKYIRDWVYILVSNKRYTWFGKKNICMIMTDDIKHKFLENYE